MTAPNHSRMGREEDPLGGSGTSPLDDFDWGDPVVDTAAAKGSSPGPTPIPGLVPTAAPEAAPEPSPRTSPPAPAFEPVLEWAPAANPAPAPAPGPARPPEPAPVPGVWPGASASGSGLLPPATSAPPPSQPRALDFVAQRIRERYFRARFPEMEPPSPANPDPSPIIKSARLYFEDGDVERSAELLQQSSEMLPREDRLLLAKLEIHFLTRDAARFAATARVFEQRFPASPDVPKIRRFGERLAVEARMAAGTASPDERYGAWPEIANWIEAPWDLTSEVLAVELRSRLLSMPATADAAGGA